MAKRGRKCKYDTHVKPYLDRIPVWRKQGMTEEQIAVTLGIDGATLCRYKKQFSEFCEAIKEGKKELIEILEETLYKRAIGIEYEEVKTYIDQDAEGNMKKRIERTKKMHFSDSDLIFALKNLNKEKWKDKHEFDHTGIAPVTIVDDIL